MKTMVYSPDGDTDFFDIVTRVLQRYILAPYVFRALLTSAVNKPTASLQKDKTSLPNDSPVLKLKA